MPCSKFTIIEYNTDQELENPISNELISFLEKNFDEPLNHIEHLRTEITFKKITFDSSSDIKVIPNRSILPFPIISNLFLSLVAIFTFSTNLDTKSILNYGEWLELHAKNYSKLNLFFLDPEKLENIHNYGSLIHGKDIYYINSISRFILRSRFNSKFKKQNLTKTDFQIFTQILNQFYSI